MTNSSKEWPFWTDVLGNEYKPGDLIAVSTVSGRSPQMVIARVEKINKVNSQGEPHMANKWFDHEEPIPRTRECWRAKSPEGLYYGCRPHICVFECTNYMEIGETRRVPSCTVRATPLIDARGFSRWNTKEDGSTKAVTYSIPENIIALHGLSQ